MWIEVPVKQETSLNIEKKGSQKKQRKKRNHTFDTFKHMIPFQEEGITEDYSPIYKHQVTRDLNWILHSESLIKKEFFGVDIVYPKEYFEETKIIEFLDELDENSSLFYEWL